MIECPKSLEDVSVMSLLSGLHWTNQDELLDAVTDLKVAGAGQHQQVLEKIDETSALMQREFLKQFYQEQRLIESHCPGVFVLRSHEASGWRKLIASVRGRVIGQRLALQLYCQQPGYWHPTLKGGLYEIDELAEWLREVAPLLRGIATVLRYVAPLAGPAAAWAVPNFEVIYKADIDFTKAIVEKLPEFKSDEG
jgi:internalin A